MSAKNERIVNLTGRLSDKGMSALGVENIDGIERGMIVTALTAPPSPSRVTMMQRARKVAEVARGADKAVIRASTPFTGFLEKALREINVTPLHPIYKYNHVYTPINESGKKTDGGIIVTEEFILEAFLEAA